MIAVECRGLLGTGPGDTVDTRLTVLASTHTAWLPLYRPYQNRAGGERMRL